MPRKSNEERAAYQREYHARWRVANREKLKAYHAAYYEANKEGWNDKRGPWKPEYAKSRSRASDPQRAAKEYAANPEAAKARTRRWAKKNPEKVKAIYHARRARQIAAEGRYTADDVARITELQRGRCACCRAKRKLTVDHIVPLAKGGSNWPRNLQMLCGPCNHKKNAKDPIKHRQELGLLL